MMSRGVPNGVMDYNRYILIPIVFVLIALCVSISFAQSTPITGGLTYLQSTQSPEGYWGDASEVPYNSIVDTCTVAETLKYLNETGTAYNSAIQWINTTEVFNNDYLFIKMLVLAQAGFDVSIIRDYLLSIRNDDGGWGVEEGFESDIKRTALSLLALKSANYSDQSTIGSALSYLISIQNSDGGFGFYQGDDSNVYMTAVVSTTLQQFPQTTSLTTAINKATTYLISHQNADGGFGSSTSSVSTIYETALVYIALVGVITDNTVLGNAINYITSTQLSNGSWNDDPYSTALALRALYLSENKPVPPPSPTTGTVTGKLVDASTNQPLGGVSVVLQSDTTINTLTDGTGNFTLSNIPPGSQKINFSLSGYATATTTVNITAGSIINLGTITLSSNPTTGIIKGTVTDASNGQPLEGVAITVTGSFTGSTVTGIDGSFIFTNITPGSVTITTEKTGYYSITGTGTVVAGETLFFNPQLSTTPPQTTTGNLTGKVFDGSTNTPIQGATVSLSGGSSTSTDASGVFLIKDITPNTYQVTISASGYTSQVYQVMILAGVTTDMQVIYLASSPQATTITGKVTDAQTGKPIAGAEVVVVGTSPSTGSGQALSAKTDSTGTYTLTGINLLEFNLRASATGYDSLAYAITTTNYGTYTVDFLLNPSQSSDLRITSLTTDKQEYFSNALVNIVATIENTGDEQTDVSIRAQISDQYGNILGLVSYPEIPLLISPHSTETVTLQWNTGQNPPNSYEVTLNIIDFIMGGLLAEGYTSFAITSTVMVDEVLPFITPKFINIRATETINLSTYMVNRSNIDTFLSAEYEIKNPGGNLINNGMVNFSLTTSESFKVIELTNFTNTFNQSGQYPVTVRIISEGTVLSEKSDAIYVAPFIRIEPSKSLNPTTVTPDGDKVIRIDIQMKGVEDRP